MVQDRGCGHVVNTRISGGRIGFGFSTQGSARLTNCTVAGVHFGVSIIVNKPAEVVMEGNKISAKMLVMSIVLLFHTSVAQGYSLLWSMFHLSCYLCHDNIYDVLIM